MYIKILWNYIIGYVNIQIEGFYIERFVNICKSKNILLWNMDRKKSSILYSDISINDFKKIKEIARKTNCRVKINTKKGMPFIVYKYKKRKIFSCLLLFVMLLLIISSNFIWNIEIKGAKKVPVEEIKSMLQENGLKIGAFKKNIDVKKIISKIRLNREDISWIGIEFKGTNAIIEIAESDKKPKIVDNNDFCNIISDKMGIITKIDVQNGTSIAKIDDIVKPGDILVEGKIQGKYMEPIYVHSSANIEAKVWYSKKDKFEYHQTIEEKTGNEETKYEIKINNLKINLYKTLSKFENYDTINENKKLSIFSNFYLPIEIIKKVNREKEKHEIIYGKEELKNIAVEQLEEELKKEIQEQEKILNKYINIKEQEGYLEVEVVYEVLENIGTKEKIIF